MSLSSLDSLPLFSSRLDVDLDALSENLKVIKESVKPSRVIAVMKANALGHGTRTIARALEESGADMIAVSNFLEAVVIRESGVKMPVLVMNGLTPTQMEYAIRQNISFFGFNEQSVRTASRLAETAGVTARLHIKVDTGHGRMGVLPEEARDLAVVLDGVRHVKVEGIVSHLASPYIGGSHDEFSRAQLSRFLDAAKVLDPDHKATWHLAASSGAIRFPEMRLDAVRVGALLFGVGRVWPLPWPCKQVASLKATVVQVRRLPAGRNVGYSLNYTTKRDTHLAIVPVGSVDGLFGDHASGGAVLIRGTRCPIVGICSCEMMVDVTGVAGVTPGDEVVMFGRQSDDFISIVDCAEMGKSSYANVLTKIPARVPRVYWRQGIPVSVEALTL